MSRRGLLLLIVVTLAITAAAVWSTIRRDRGIEPHFQPGPIFPALAERAQAVAQIDVATRNTMVRIKREGQRWVVASQSDYPAKADLVHRTIFALINAKATDRATALPENHRKIGLVAPDKGGGATRVLLLDEAGSQLAALLIGNPVPNEGPPTGPQSYFVRKLGDDQAWIAEGDFPIESDVRAWVEPDIADIDRARIASATVTFPDGTGYTVSRKAPDQPDFVVSAVPKGHEPAKDTGVANALGNAAGMLSFDNVRPRAKAGFPDKAEHVVYRTFDGLVLDVALAKLDDGGTWATFAASLDEAIVPAEAAPSSAPAPAPTAPAPAPTAPAPTGNDKTAATPAADAVKPPLLAPDAVRKEAAAIDARTGGWAYRLPDTIAGDLSHPLADVVAPKKAKSPAASKKSRSKSSRKSHHHAR
jgi:hypothetical protein